MATFRVSEADAARDFAGLMSRVRAGAKVVIEADALPIADIHAPASPGRTLEQAIALLPEDSETTIDEGFAHDVDAASTALRSRLDPPWWN